MSLKNLHMPTDHMLGPTYLMYCLFPKATTLMGPDKEGLVNGDRCSAGASMPTPWAWPVSGTLMESSEEDTHLMASWHLHVQ